MKGDRTIILNQFGLHKLEKGSLGIDQEVLDSLICNSLDSWSTKTAALQQQFAEARLRAEKLLEPKTQQVKLSSSVLRTNEDVDEWLDETKQTLLEKIKKGPVIIS